jgi:uncharacterized membrane protein
MSEYQQTASVNAPVDEVFAWVADAGNLPHYLPPIKEARLEGDGDQVRLWGEIPDQGEFESEGYFRVMEDQRRMEWGANVYRDYSGWLQVEPSGEAASEVTVHLSFGGASVEGQIQEQSSDERDPLEEGVEATLESIRRQIEEGSGKVDQPAASG